MFLLEEIQNHNRLISNGGIMPIQTIEKEIDGHQIKIVQFYAVRGFKIKARLFRIVLPILTSLVDPNDLKSGKNILDLKLNVSNSIGIISSTLDPEILFPLLLDLLSGVFVDGQVIDEKKFNELFIGNYTFAYKLAYEAIMVNGFFDLGGIGNLMKGKLNPISPIN
jgi:hypothetical protein